ncbi:MAG: chemotaxis protein CheW [Deltaproteobacteria bacterium]|nr:chemotaxis protein CheW [Deltaproteobacteria bacterium]
MSIQDDETLRLYVEESMEHLSDIENDLLAIEAAGADIDEEIVNKVFRAAHSIKGGAGFMGLTNIKELAHKMENVLGMIREREMIPNPEIVNILLLSSDSLRNLLSSVSTSNETDISEHIDALMALTANSLPDGEQEELSDRADISFPDGKTVFKVPKYDISNARKKGNFIYLVEYDLIHDIHNKNKTPLALLKKMQESGIILDCKIDMGAVGFLDSDIISNRIPFLVLYATILEPDMINALFEIDEERVFELTPDFIVQPVGKPKIFEISMPEEQTLSPSTEPSKKEITVDEEEIPTPFQPLSAGQKSEDDKKQKTAPGILSTETSLRVSVGLLDSLMNLAGELVLGRNQLLQAITLKDFRSIEASGQHLDLITSEIQEAIMLTRMQPIGNVLNKFPRVVRDLARDLKKEVRLTIDGEGVELDKTILEAINDPLTHLVRNAVDHGIEKPDVRRKAGKDVTGHVHLRAYHEAGQVNIEIRDDGKGIDPSRLAAAAQSKGLISENQAMIMSDKEKVNLVFLPGFSTADEVSDVSGRGVGMDVVKTNLDKLGGVVEIDSVMGKGTTINIKLPLTLAIIPSQLISAGGERYAIPQVNLEELFRIPADQVKNRIEKVGDAEVVRLRGNLLPLIRLADVIDIDRIYMDPKEKREKQDRRKDIADRRSKRSPFKRSTQAGRGEQPEEMNEQTDDRVDSDETTDKRRQNSDRRYHASSAVNIVVVYTGALKYGLVVDELHDSEEIVVKPLGRHLKHCKGYAGATIMGDGRVALILDVAGLSQMAQLTSMEGTDRAMEVAREQQQAAVQQDVQSMLIFRNAEEEQFAVPLGFVERIEKIKKSDIEEVGNKRVMQYRGYSLPLFAIEEAAKVRPLADKEELLVIVFTVANREIGLLATPPLDAIEESIDIDTTTLKQNGIKGSAIIRDYTTLIVDIIGLVKSINPEWFEGKDMETPETDSKNAIILYAEDSNFFRSQVKEFLEDDGYEVIEAEDGLIAWDLMQKHAKDLSLVITDIEMPNLDGFGFAKKIRGDKRFSDLPIIALTTMASDEDVAKGKDVGIDDYQIKLDRDKLMESVYRFLKKK